MQKRKWLLLVSVLLTLLLTLSSISACSTPAPTPAPSPAPGKPAATTPAAPPKETAADFYKGKAITIGLTAGSGSVMELYTRTIGQKLGDILGARVGVNYNPAAGGMAYFNELYNVIKPDGLHILFLSAGTIWRPWLVADPAVKYDPTKYEYLAGQKNGQYILNMSPKTTYKTVELLKKGKGLKFSASAPTSGLTLTNCLAIEVLGLDGKVIVGYSGTEGRQLAVTQGEVDGYVGSADEAKRIFKNGLMWPIFQMGLKREAPWPDVPCLAELAEPTENNKRLLKGLDAYADYRMLIAPPGTPSDRVKLLADTITKIYNDKDFIATVEKSTGSEWLGSLTAGECNAIVKEVPTYKDTMKVFEALGTKYIQK